MKVTLYSNLNYFSFSSFLLLLILFLFFFVFLLLFLLQFFIFLFQILHFPSSLLSLQLCLSCIIQNFITYRPLGAGGEGVTQIIFLQKIIWLGGIFLLTPLSLLILFNGLESKKPLLSSGFHMKLLSSYNNKKF